MKNGNQVGVIGAESGQRFANRPRAEAHGAQLLAFKNADVLGENEHAGFR